MTRGRETWHQELRQWNVAPPQWPAAARARRRNRRRPDRIAFPLSVSVISAPRRAVPYIFLGRLRACVRACGTWRLWCPPLIAWSTSLSTRIVFLPFCRRPSHLFNFSQPVVSLRSSAGMPTPRNRTRQGPRTNKKNETIQSNPTSAARGGLGPFRKLNSINSNMEQLHKKLEFVE